MNRFFEVVDKSAKDSFPNLLKPIPPSLLYHYTSFDSSKKILEGNSIRFTHINFMNDRQEMRYGLDMFYELVRLLIKNEKDERIRYFLHVLFCSIVATFENERKRSGLFSSLKDNCFDKDNPEQYAVFNEGTPKDFYVACFSAEGAKNSLPMWHMYAGHGTGVCLGFDAKKLIEAHQKQYEGFPEPFHTSCQGCSTLFTEGHRKYGFETAESGGVAVLRDCVGLIEPENIVGEASNSREDARIFSNARCVFA